MGARGRELVATDEPTVVSKLFFDAIVVEDSQSDGSFPNSSWANECDWSETLSETDDLLDQPVAPKAGPWWLGREFGVFRRW